VETYRRYVRRSADAQEAQSLLNDPELGEMARME